MEEHVDMGEGVGLVKGNVTMEVLNASQIELTDSLFVDIVSDLCIKHERPLEAIEH